MHQSQSATVTKILSLQATTRARERDLSRQERKQTGTAGLRTFIVVRDMASTNLLMLPPQINATLDAQTLSINIRNLMIVRDILCLYHTFSLYSFYILYIFCFIFISVLVFGFIFVASRRSFFFTPSLSKGDDTVCRKKTKK